MKKVIEIAMKSFFITLCHVAILTEFCFSFQAFHPARFDFLTDVSPVEAALLDYNLDGINDVAVICGEENGMLTIFKGTADETLHFVWGVYCGNMPGELEVMDVNMDSIPDVIVSLTSEGLIRTFYGSLGGQFTPGESLYAGLNPLHLELTDVEGDGDEELMASGTRTIFLYKRQPREGLIEFQRYPLLDIISDFDTGDMNGDGFGDIVLTYESEGTHLYFGDGNGQIASGLKIEELSHEEETIVDIKMVDIDLDGHEDLLAIDSGGDQFSILWGDGNGGFKQTRVSYDDLTASLVVPGPVGRAGIRDIISVSEASGEIQIHSGKICGAAMVEPVFGEDLPGMSRRGPANIKYCFAERGEKYRCGLETVWVDVTDFNNDSIPDIFALNKGSGSLSLFYGAGDGYYHSAPDFWTGPGEMGAKSVAVLDANEDGHDDVAVAFKLEDAISILLGDGAGNLCFYSTFPTGGSGTHTLGVGDLDEDGHEDIVVRNVQSSSVSVLLGDGNANYELVGEFETDEGTHLVTLVDINLDEHLDVITPNARGGTITILLGDGTGHLERYVDIPVGLGPHSCVAFDYDQDGDQDIASANSNEDSVAILRNDIGVIRLAGKVATGKHPISVCSGDFNEDGFPDLATANIGGFTVSVLLGDGRGSFQNLTGDLVAGNGPHYVVTKDMNRDNHLDLIAPVTGMDGVVVFYGDGNGSFREEGHFGTGDNPNTVSIGDFDEDLMPDIVTGNVLSSDVSLLMNAGNPSGLPITESH
ncbi:MAG: FG-GAP repeat domain-containing protein [Candidatus Glassbacteria bacterium]